MLWLLSAIVSKGGTTLILLDAAVILKHKAKHGRSVTDQRKTDLNLTLRQYFCCLTKGRILWRSRWFESRLKPSTPIAC